MSHQSPFMNGRYSPDRKSSETSSSFDLTPEDPETQALYSPGRLPERNISLVEKFQSFLCTRNSNALCSNSLRARRTKYRRDRQKLCLLPRPRRLCFLLQTLLFVAILLAAFVALVFPSYASPPARYHDLRLLAQSSSEAGRANPGNEKIFIATSIFDANGDLARGVWGKSIVNLIDLLGPSNVFLSIYENGAGPEAEAALRELEEKTSCEHAIVFEKQLGLDTVPTIELPSGDRRTKRIAYLAETRNRALRPLDSSRTKYDKLLFLNDVMFDPVNAVQLLFATNAESGKAEYRAACAMDFSTPFKFYDTFASRDLEGYSMGLPIYPWFSGAGKSQSRQDVFDQRDAVRVRSCWGGMVAFDAKFFQSIPEEFDDLDTTGSMDGEDFKGFRFRAESELFWESAECCLIQADIQSREIDDRGIYMNPYIRVAYDTTTMAWIGASRRIERLYTPIQYLINSIVGLPWYNPRRAEQAWQEVQDKVWSPNATLSAGGSFRSMDRIATNAGFCGTRALQVLKEHRQPGETNWEFIPVPDG